MEKDKIEELIDSLASSIQGYEKDIEKYEKMYCDLYDKLNQPEGFDVGGSFLNDLRKFKDLAVKEQEYLYSLLSGKNS